MNLFCFTLEGSTDSIYEPAYGQTLKETPHKCHCSPARLRPKSDWGGSAPSINSGQLRNPTKSKKDNRRSCMATPTLENESLEKDNHPHWMSSGDKMNLSHQKKAQNNASCQNSVLTREEKTKDLISERTPTDLLTQHGETASDAAESIQTKGRLKKWQNLVQAKKGHQSNSEKVKNANDKNDCLAEVVRNNNAVLTCISLGRRTDKKSSQTKTSPQQLQQHHNRDLQEDPEEERVWSPKIGSHHWRPFDCPQSWTPFYHTCQQPPPELLACAGSLSLPRTSEWDRFESLIKELDSKQSDMCLPYMIHSITDLHFPQNTEKQEQKCEPPKLKLERTEIQASSQIDGKHVESSPEKTRTALIGEDMQRDEAEKSKASRRKPSTEGKRQSRNSLESLYSLNSGQSSSSGVTSGSACSSNRDSLRLDDDLLLTRQFCGRARVHTEYVPSPYDTESLKLKVGDVIDIIAKPPMGIWKGILDGRVGNFKFIYVDVLTETHIHGVRHKSTVREMLKRLSLEEHSLLLQSSGYQTVDDLMRLRERDLMELNVTDPEHKQRLLAAVNSLQQLYSDSKLENEVRRESEIFNGDMKADMNNCPRDSGCLMTSDSPDDCTDDPEPHFPLEHFVPADMAVS